MIKQVAVFCAVLFLLPSAALAQRRFEFSLSGMGALSKQSSGNQVVLNPTQSGGLVVSAGVRLAPKFSLQANFGHLYNSQKYETTTLNYRVASTVSEVTGALVFRPFATEKWKPFVFAGTGVLVFNPDYTTVFGPNPGNPSNPVIETPQYIGATRQTEPVVLYGGGVDRRLPYLSFVSVRLQYRGLIYNAPSYHLGFLFAGSRGHLAEPSIGLVVRF